jgi:anti-sigma factor RsiW
MLSCEEARRIIALYLDSELHGVELARFEAHIDVCEGCEYLLAREKEWLTTLRAASPLYRVPDQLRQSIELLVRADSSAKLNAPAPEALRRHIRRLVRNHVLIGNLRANWLKAAAVIVIIATVGALVWLRQERWSGKNLGGPSAFALMSVDSHLRHQRGQLPLEVTTDSAKAVMEWFAGKLMFNLKLPNYDAPSEHPKPYTLEGARLVGFEEDYAAYVAYQMENQLISLIVTSANVARPSGGEIISSQGIPFHFETINGLKVITWTENGLTYALVSDLAERGQASCIVCHQDKQQQITKPFQR